MNKNDDFSKFSDTVEELRFEVPVNRTNHCKYAREFADWADNLCGSDSDPTMDDVNLAKLMLQERYFEWCQSVPKRHRNKLSKQGHTCIYQVYFDTFFRLKEVEFSLNPPILTGNNNPKIAGIYMGDLRKE